MKKSVKKRSLKSIIIEPFKQIRFGLYVIGASLAFVLIAAWLFYDSFSAQYIHILDLFSVVDPELRQQFVLDDVFYANAFRLILFFAIFLVVMFTMIFRLTHRYYGPLVSIERFLDQLIEGKYDTRVSIRKKDELQNLANQLNKLAEALQKRHNDHEPK